MTIIPAIDLHDGKCVRLMRGDFGTAHKVAECAVETALCFQECGASILHMVDLDGARTGQRKNRDIVARVIRETGLSVELGGGIRAMSDVEDAFELGVSRVVIGSAAVSEPAFIREAAARYGDRIAVGIDSLNGVVRTAGWLTSAGVSDVTFAKEMAELGVGTIIFTDIARDGLQEGPSFDRLREMRAAVKCLLIASGGVTSIQDVLKLKELNIDGAIVGKAVYSGSIDLKKAIDTATA